MILSRTSVLSTICIDITDTLLQIWYLWRGRLETDDVFISGCAEYAHNKAREIRGSEPWGAAELLRSSFVSEVRESNGAANATCKAKALQTIMLKSFTTAGKHLYISHTRDGKYLQGSFPQKRGFDISRDDLE